LIRSSSLAVTKEHVDRDAVSEEKKVNYLVRREEMPMEERDQEVQLTNRTPPDTTPRAGGAALE